MTRPAPRPLGIGVAIAVMALAVLLAWLASQVNARANRDLLDRQVEQAATVLSNAVEVRQVQLADAAQVATATGADPVRFGRFAAAQLTGTNTFSSVSLLRVQGGSVQVLTTEGDEPLMPPGDLGSSFFTDLVPAGELVSAGILPGEPSRLGYAFMPAGDTGLVVYAEQALAPDRRTDVPATAAFGGLDLAVYLGPRAATDQLLLATADVPIEGDTETASLPFGNTSITVVGAARSQLTGALSAALPAIVLGVGGVLAVVSGATVHTLSRRRTLAERLAADNERLYLQQRGIAATLQHALLPQVPVVDGLEVAARYVAGADDLDVGGDWYDVIPRGAGGCVFVVGDISGRGLPAATTMASLRFAVRAYLAQGDPVETVMTRLRGLLDVSDGHQFATVLIGELDPAQRTVRLVCAGHFPPLLVADGRAEFLDCPVDPPVGVGGPIASTATVLSLAGPGTLLAFTDGLVERRTEVIDVGLRRLSEAAVAVGTLPIEGVLDGVMTALAHDGGRDDTVLMGLRWT